MMCSLIPPSRVLLQDSCGSYAQSKFSAQNLTNGF
nr:MAG TPA_asm: hypothetical protein [Caudoviricetes sp.]